MGRWRALRQKQCRARRWSKRDLRSTRAALRTGQFLYRTVHRGKDAGTSNISVVRLDERTYRFRNEVTGAFRQTWGSAARIERSQTLIQVKSKEDAMEWARRFPNPAVDGKDAEVEVRQLYELDDFGPSEAVERFGKMEVG